MAPQGKSVRDVDTEPIADLNLPCVCCVRANRPDLILPRLPLLPNPGAPNFLEILDGKLQILQADLFYPDPNADIAAKAIKLDVLKELLPFSCDHRLQTCCKQLDVIINAIESPILRSRPRIDPIYFRLDDTPQYQEPSWPHLALNYQILNGFIENGARNSRFDLSYAKRLILAFDSPDCRERKRLAQLVIAIGKRSPDIMSAIFKIVCHCLAGYRDGSRTNFSVMPALLVCSEYISPRPPSARDQSLVPFCISYLIPLIKGKHFADFQDVFMPIADFFVSTGLKPIVTATWKTIVNNFPVSHFEKAVALLNLLTATLLKMGPEELTGNLRIIAALYARCATWGQFKLCKASFQIWNRPELLRRIHPEAEAMLPSVFPIILRAARTPWIGTIAQVLGDTLAALSAMNPMVCQSLRTQKHTPEMLERVKMWSSLAKYTARKEPEFCMAEWLASLQRLIVPFEYDPRPQAGIVRAESGPSVIPAPSIVGPARTLTRGPAGPAALSKARARLTASHLA
jgi:hypothetical protein